MPKILLKILAGCKVDETRPISLPGEDHFPIW